MNSDSSHDINHPLDEVVQLDSNDLLNLTNEGLIDLLRESDSVYEDEVGDEVFCVSFESPPGEILNLSEEELVQELNWRREREQASAAS